MAKNNKTAAQAAEVKNEQNAQVETSVENIEEQIKAGNKFNEELAKKAAEKNAEDEEKRKIAELAQQQSIADWVNKRELLDLKKRRKEDRATKECLTKTKELLDDLNGGKLTILEYKNKIKEVYRDKFKAFDEIDKWFNDLVSELRNCYVGWESNWEYNNRNNRWNY